MSYDPSVSFPARPLYLRYWSPPQLPQPPPTPPDTKIMIAVAVLAPSKHKCLLVFDKRPIIEADVNTLHAIDSDATESISRATTRRDDDIRVTGKRIPSAGYVKAQEGRERVSSSGSSQGTTLTSPRTSLVALPLTGGGPGGGRLRALLHRRHRNCQMWGICQHLPCHHRNHRHHRHHRRLPI